MKIRLTTSLSGPLFSLSPGDECEFPDEEAQRLVDAGFALPVVDTPPAETTDKKAAKETRG